MDDASKCALSRGYSSHAESGHELGALLQIAEAVAQSDQKPGASIGRRDHIRDTPKRQARLQRGGARLRRSVGFPRGREVFSGCLRGGEAGRLGVVL